MPRRKQNSSAAATAGGILSVLLFIGVSVAVVILRAERRAARNQDTAQSDGYRGGGDASPVDSAAPPVAPFTPNSPAQPQPNLNSQPGQSRPQVLLPVAAPELRRNDLGLKFGVRETDPTGGAFANIDYREYRPEGSILIG